MHPKKKKASLAATAPGKALWGLGPRLIQFIRGFVTSWERKRERTKSPERKGKGWSIGTEHLASQFRPRPLRKKDVGGQSTLQCGRGRETGDPEERENSIKAKKRRLPRMGPRKRKKKSLLSAVTKTSTGGEGRKTKETSVRGSPFGTKGGAQKQGGSGVDECRLRVNRVDERRG